MNTLLRACETSALTSTPLRLEVAFALGRGKQGHVEAIRVGHMVKRTLCLLSALAVGCASIASVSELETVPGSEAQGQSSWRGLVVAPERRCSPYEAGDYQYSRSVEDRIVAQLGGVYGPFTGRWFTSKSETDIEHIVARSEAHDSGLCAADGGTKRRFSNDLINLTLAAPSVNRYQKRDHDAAEWLPERNRCWFAARVVAVRQKYELTIDQAEADALESVLAGCASTGMVVSPHGRGAGRSRGRLRTDT